MAPEIQPLAGTSVAVAAVSSGSTSRPEAVTRSRRSPNFPAPLLRTRTKYVLVAGMMVCLYLTRLSDASVKKPPTGNSVTPSAWSRVTSAVGPAGAGVAPGGGMARVAVWSMVRSCATSRTTSPAVPAKVNQWVPAAEKEPVTSDAYLNAVAPAGVVLVAVSAAGTYGVAW